MLYITVLREIVEKYFEQYTLTPKGCEFLALLLSTQIGTGSPSMDKQQQESIECRKRYGAGLLNIIIFLLLDVSLSLDRHRHHHYHNYHWFTRTSISVIETPLVVTELANSYSWRQHRPVDGGCSEIRELLEIPRAYY